MSIEINQMETVFHIPDPWFIKSCHFNNVSKQLDVYIYFPKGALFPCSNCGNPDQEVYDIADHHRTWRHLNFLEYPCYIHADHPRTRCRKCSKIRRVNVPWAVKPRTGFTTLFDAWIIALAKDMPMNAISRMVKEHDTLLWRILHYYVDHSIATQDLSHVTKISTDETSSKRGHNYITIFMDPEKANVIHVTEGKDAGTWAACKKHLEAHGGKAENVTELCMDMSPAFIKGATKNFPNAAMTFDKFHIIQSANEAVDSVRKRERKSSLELKNTRYIWLKNEENLTEKKKETLEKLKDCELDTAKAYRMRLVLQQIYRYPASIAPMVMKDWIQWGLRCRLEPMVEVAKMLHSHYDGVVQWFTSKLNNGLLEGINSLFQAAKRKARGYRSPKNMVAIIYLLAGKFDFALRQ
ncbi:Transposase [Evansella caseinilytica]|uniref:Transposase n=1 Tax=Evansella caseinilytica TaxID=1503961 RepID=A0A1H3G8J4_9BACI|nr:ISL3 family transposase [Evansella caseinilytica]SDX99581.1 Transposase [Evansella caseinilytica]